MSKSSPAADIAVSILARVSDLFSDAAAERADAVAPLPQRIRPRSLDELVGQTGVLGPGSALRRAIDEGRAPSMILHGPPGVGKTTIARIVAEASSATFEELSAVSARVDDVRAVLARARDRLGGNGLRTLLFIDEIHRFDKRQQDSVLHAVEEGLVTLIGATTENPYFEVNQALLSRCTVIELESLTEDELGVVLARGAQAARHGGPGRTSPRRSRGGRGATPAPRSRRSSSRGRPRAPAARPSRRARRRRRAEAAAPLRPRRRPPLRPRLGVHQVDARRAIPTPPSTTSRRCSKAARTHGSSPAGS